MQRGPRPGGDTPQGSPRGRSPEAIKEHFKAMDKDGDGKLSKEEAPGPLKQHFDKIDADDDGGITPEEIRAAFQKLHEQMRKKMEARRKADA